MKDAKPIIAIDFDGTCVTHEFPDIGQSIGAEAVLRELQKRYHLILWTIRSGATLDDAVAWFEKNNILLYGVNENPVQKLWSSSPKAYATLYIDDAAFGAPLIQSDICKRPYINWKVVEKQLGAKPSEGVK